MSDKGTSGLAYQVEKLHMLRDSMLAWSKIGELDHDDGTVKPSTGYFEGAMQILSEAIGEIEAIL